MITKTKLVKRIFSSLLTVALAVPMTALTAHATGEAFFYPPKNLVNCPHLERSCPNVADVVRYRRTGACRKPVDNDK